VHAGSPIDVYYGSYPNVHVEANAQNQCFVTSYQEVTGTVQLFSAGSWTGVASCTDSIDSPGEIECNANYGCPVYLPVRYWRNQAIGYSVVNGIGYLGTNTSDTWGFPCA
jgi:hypothetical protein